VARQAANSTYATPSAMDHASIFISRVIVRSATLGSTSAGRLADQIIFDGAAPAQERAAPCIGCVRDMHNALSRQENLAQR
jgi:hypothetical protein